MPWQSIRRLCPSDIAASWATSLVSVVQVSDRKKRMLEAIKASADKRQRVGGSDAHDDSPVWISRGKAAILHKEGLSLFEVLWELMQLPPPRTRTHLQQVTAKVCVYLDRLTRRRCMCPSTRSCPQDCVYTALVAPLAVPRPDWCSRFTVEGFAQQGIVQGRVLGRVPCVHGTAAAGAASPKREERPQPPAGSQTRRRC